MTVRHLRACALTLDADPHPTEIYARALLKAAGIEVSARGESKGKITRIRKIREVDAYSGRLLIWTDIDLEAPWLDKVKEEELAEEERANISIPDNVAPNFKSFDFVFLTSDHRLYIETRNEIGSTLGPRTIKNVFERLLHVDILGTDYPEISVTLVPDEQAIEKVLGMPSLRRLSLRIRTPNADYSSPAARQRVMRMMQDNQAHVLDQEWVKPASAVRLTPTAELSDIARVAADTGYARGEGRQADGSSKTLATDNMPKIYTLSTENGDTFFARLRTAISRRFS